MCTYVCSSAQLFISRNNDFEIRANEYSLTHSQFQLHSLSPLPPSLSHSVSNPFSIPSPPLSPLLPFLPRLPAFYRTWVGCARGWCGGFAGGVSLCMCVKPVTPICLVCTACFSAGEGRSAAVSIDGRRPISFCFVVPRRRTLFPHAFRPHRRTQTLAVWLASSKLRSVTVVPFSLVTIHIPLLLSSRGSIGERIQLCRPVYIRLQCASR